jgi:hypothetical protein
MEHDDWCCDLRVNEYTALNIAVRQPLRGRRQQSVGQIVQPIPRRAQPQDAAGLGLEAEREAVRDRIHRNADDAVLLAAVFRFCLVTTPRETAMITLVFRRSFAAVATSREGHRSPRSDPEVQHRRWERGRRPKCHRNGSRR